MGNGPSINQYPADFLKMKPSVAVNYFPWYHKHVTPDFWTCWDTSPLLDMLPVALMRGIKCIVNPKDLNYFQKKKIEVPKCYFWKNMEQHRGFGFQQTHGVTYTSSIHWACHIALFLLGFTTLYVLGFDCTTGTGSYQGKGIGAVPHFYDLKEGEQVRYQAKWDQQFQEMILKYKEENRGWTIINLSTGSRAKLFPAEDWRPHYEKFKLQEESLGHQGGAGRILRRRGRG